MRCNQLTLFFIYRRSVIIHNHMKRTLAIIALLACALTTNAQILWKISGNGLNKPSYLFGTHHVADQTICNEIAGFNDAYSSVEQVYGEVDMKDMNSVSNMIKMMSYMKMPKDMTLSSLYTAEQVEIIDEFLTQNLGTGIKSFDMFKPVMASSAVQVKIAMKVYPEFDADKAIDSHMQEKARKDRKIVRGLESISFQAEMLYNTPIEEQAKELLEVAEQGAEAEKAILDLTELYRKQDIQGLWGLMLEDSEPEELEKLVYSRNRNWVKQMKHILPSASAMFVVGAGHLPGDQGLIKLLETEGYTLEPVW